MKNQPLSIRIRPTPVRPKSRLRTAAISILLVGAGILALGGCASTKPSAGKGKQALVCPQCKMVAMTVSRPYGSYSNSYRSGGTQTVYKDTCPGCQGVIETLFKEGKWEHKCSVCKDSPFTCSVSHPPTT